jgi:hypothetical protein
MSLRYKGFEKRPSGSLEEYLNGKEKIRNEFGYGFKDEFLFVVGVTCCGLLANGRFSAKDRHRKISQGRPFIF